MDQHDICVCAYPVVRVRGVMCCTKLRVVMCEGNVVVCIEQDAICNYEWHGPSFLPGVYDATDTVGKYLFRDDGVP